MFRKIVLASSALALTLTPIAAQAAPQPVTRTGAEIGESEQLVGTTLWIAIAIGLGLAIWGIIELTSDDEPTSP